jgi:hypothetical protein
LEVGEQPLATEYYTTYTTGGLIYEADVFSWMYALKGEINKNVQ